MIYDIAGLRVSLENKHEYTTKFCEEFLSEDQASPVDITARVTDEEFAEEQEQSPGFPDGYIENICLYRSICREIPLMDRMLLHASVLEYEGGAYAFLGKSGTGKSTHSKLWGQSIAGVGVINGDKPILQYIGDRFIAYGTPWRGKERWGGKKSAPLKGLCFLEQAKENSIRNLTPSEVSSRLFMQILIPTDENAAIATLDLADKLIATTPAFLLQCDISEDAVKASFEAMTGKSFEASRRK